MKIVRTVIVFDAPDLEVESNFWAKVLGGQVLRDERWHSVIDNTGQWRIGIQLNPTHKQPVWPHGDQQQQIHLDLHVEDSLQSHEELLRLGARVLLKAEDIYAESGFQVYADPAGHPFCMGWGHPTSEQLTDFLNEK
jgi:hypothetical protein